MPDDKTIDFVVAFVTIGMLVLGLGSVLLGWAVRIWDRVMSRFVTPVPETGARNRERRPDAAGQRGNSVEQGVGTVSPSLIEYLEQCSDETRLDILAQLRDADGEWLYAESRVARFIGGRVEDRIAQVRAVRGIEPDPPAVRQIRVRDEQGERLIPM